MTREEILSSTEGELINLAMAKENPLQKQEVVQSFISKGLNKSQKDKMEKLSEHIHFKIPNSKVELNSWNALTDGIMYKKKVRINYRGMNETKYHLIHPYDLFFSHQAWYLIAYSEEDKIVRVFRVNRIEHIHTSGTGNFEVKPDYNYKEQYGKFGYVRPADKGFSAEIWFNDFFARVIAEVDWCDNQKIEWLDDKSIILKGKFYDLENLCLWVMGFGERAKILKPKKAVDEHKRILMECLDNYK